MRVLPNIYKGNMHFLGWDNLGITAPISGWKSEETSGNGKNSRQRPGETKNPDFTGLS